MKRALVTITILLLANLCASEEYPYIKPISVEHGTVKKAVVPSPLDSDSDGVLDADDKCPNSKFGEKVDKIGCLMLKDDDADGVVNSEDICPQTPQGASVDVKGCELDSDEDGVVDSQDSCADTSKEYKVDANGCPQTTTLRVNFAPGKSNVSDSLVKELEEFANFLQENKGYQAIIYGYTDSIGSAKANKELSQKRANAVMKALGKYKISSVRLTAIGKGEANPIADNTSQEGRAQNRRIEVELLQ